MTEFPPRMIVCVGSIVLRENQVLFVRQTYGEGLQGKWSIPWGFVQGDTPDTYANPSHLAALREVQEEAGITAQIEGFLGIQHADPTKEGHPRIYLLYLCRHLSGEPRPDGVETDQAAYLSSEEMQKQKEPVDSFCYWLAMRVLTGDYSLILPNLDNPYTPNVAFL